MYEFNVIHRKLDGTEITKKEVIEIFKNRPAIEIQQTRRNDDVHSDCSNTCNTANVDIAI